MRAWLLVPLLGTLLSGCSDPSEPAAPGDGVGVITDPRDTSYLTDGSMAAGSHVHDYWGGRDRITVLEQSWDNNRWSCTGCADSGMMFARARPAEGLIVPQGTRWVNGTFTTGEDPDDLYESLELWVKTAQDSEMWLWGPLQSGMPFSIETTQETSDPPHYVLSLWQFAIRAVGGDSLSAGAAMAWTVEAVRGHPLVPYPPHPDRWGTATELDLLSDGGGTMLTYQLEAPGMDTINCMGGCPGLHTLPSGAVVPFDTDRVEVRLRITSGLPAGVGVWFHGADTWAETKATGTMPGPGEYLYTIPIEGAMADSPYAPQSLWEFQIWMDQPQPNLQAWSGAYTIDIKAFKDP